MKVCPEPGCPVLTIGGRCATHRRKSWGRSNRAGNVASGWQQQADAKAVMARDGGICHVCGKPGADRVDHVVPVAEGGPDTLANKAPIHQRPCHDRKTADEARRGRARRDRG